MALYDKYYLNRCPHCKKLMKYTTRRCPECGFPIGKLADALRWILNYSYYHYGLYNKELLKFKHDSVIRSINLSDSQYYKYFVMNQLRIIKNRYANKIFSIKKEIDDFNNWNFNSKELDQKIHDDNTYILYLILKLWRYSLIDVKNINKYYGGLISYPSVRDFDSDTRYFQQLYYEYYRICKGHAGEIAFEKKFREYEDNNPNFKYNIYHNDNIKDSFGINTNTSNTTQLDTVIVSNHGIFIPEMKNYRNSFYFDDDGNVNFVNSTKNSLISGSNNFMKQINNHKTAMYNLVIHKFHYKPIPVYSFIVDVANSYKGKSYLPVYNIKKCIQYINYQPRVIKDDNELEALNNDIRTKSKGDKSYNHFVFSHDGLYFLGELLDYLDVLFKFDIAGAKALDNE